MPKNSLCFGSPLEVSFLKGSVALSYALKVANGQMRWLCGKEGKQKEDICLLGLDCFDSFVGSKTTPSETFPETNVKV